MSVVERTLIADDSNCRAREEALRAVAQVSVEPTSLVAYHSQGRLLIIGEGARAVTVAEQLDRQGLRCQVLVQGDAVTPALFNLPMLRVSSTQRIEIRGHFGQFQVTLVGTEQGEVNVAWLLEVGREQYDLVLDLDTPTHSQWELPPLGYYAPASEADLERTLKELPEMVGEFEKATFFHYNPDICAHGSRGIKGCTRCLDACPTVAIRSLGDRVEVDPYACQGGGSCATACPSGAITYSYPKPADTLKRLRLLLWRYRELDGQHPMLLFHDAGPGKERLNRLSEPLPGHVIAVEIEEIGSVGMDIWLAALAYGSSRVWLLTTAAAPPSVVHELAEQMHVTHVLLESMGYPREALSLLDGESDCLSAAVNGDPLMPPFKPAGFVGSNAKRETLFYALDFLAAQAPSLPAEQPLPERAAFGEIQVDRAACTLCMACVSVCPGGPCSTASIRLDWNFSKPNAYSAGSVSPLARNTPSPVTRVSCSMPNDAVAGVCCMKKPPFTALSAVNPSPASA